MSYENQLFLEPLNEIQKVNEIEVIITGKFSGHQNMYNTNIALLFNKFLYKFKHNLFKIIFKLNSSSQLTDYNF